MLVSSSSASASDHFRRPVSRAGAWTPSYLQTERRWSERFSHKRNAEAKEAGVDHTGDVALLRRRKERINWDQGAQLERQVNCWERHIRGVHDDYVCACLRVRA